MENIDSLIEKLLAVTEYRLTKNVSEAELIQLCKSAADVFKSQPSLVEIDAPVVVCGDIHGQVGIFSAHLTLFSSRTCCASSTTTASRPV